MKNKVILLVVGLAMVALLAVATIFYEDLSTQFGADPITPTQPAPQEEQNFIPSDNSSPHSVQKRFFSSIF